LLIKNQRLNKGLLQRPIAFDPLQEQPLHQALFQFWKCVSLSIFLSDRPGVVQVEKLAQAKYFQRWMNDKLGSVIAVRDHRFAAV
jgi:hypothetical protein